MESGFIVKQKKDWDDDAFRKFFIDMSIIGNLYGVRTTCNVIENTVLDDVDKMGSTASSKFSSILSHSNTNYKEYVNKSYADLELTSNGHHLTTPKAS